MAPTTGDLMDLNANQASKEHSHAVVRDYISQPRLGMFYTLVFDNKFARKSTLTFK